MHKAFALSALIIILLLIIFVSVKPYRCPTTPTTADQIKRINDLLVSANAADEYFTAQQNNVSSRKYSPAKQVELAAQSAQIHQLQDEIRYLRSIILADNIANCETIPLLKKKLADRDAAIDWLAKKLEEQRRLIAVAHLYR